MKKVVVWLLTGCLFLSLAGCSDGKKQSGEAGAKGDEEINLTIMTRYNEGSEDEKYIKERLQEFSDMDNGIKVEIDNLPVEEDYLDKLRTSFANGDTPNVFSEYGGSRTLDYIESDAIVNLQPYLEEDKEWYDSFYPSFWTDFDYSDKGYEGLWGVPVKSYAVSLYYNKEIFEEQGLTPPESFDDLLEVCAKLKEAGIKPFQCGAKDSYRLGHLHNNIVLKTFGAGAAEKLADRSMAYDSEEMIGTYQVIADMIEKEYLGDDLLDTDVNTEKSVYLAGDCAMRWDGDWFVPVLLESGDMYDKTGVIPFPYINEEHKDSAQGGANDSLFISKVNKSEAEIEASVELIKFMSSQDFISKENEVASFLFPIEFTPTADTPENPVLDEVKECVSEYKEMKTDLQVYDPASHMIDTVRNAMQGLAMGNTPEQCGKEIVDRIKEYGE